MFKGLSTLRKQERKAAGNTEESKKLQAYLSKYTTSTGICQICVIRGLHSLSEAGLLSCCAPQQDLLGASSLDPSMYPYACNVCVPLLERLTWGAGDDGSEKKKRKKKKAGGAAAGLRIVDEDATGFRTGPAARMQGDDEDAEDGDEGNPIPLHSPHLPGDCIFSGPDGASMHRRRALVSFCS